jgi:hypothetical protein
MKIIFILLLSLLLGINIYSQPIFNNTKNINKTNKKFFDIRLSSNIKTASMRFDNNTMEIVKDTLIYNHIDTTTDSTKEYKLPYTTDLNQQKYNLHIGYIGLENFYIYAKLPIVYTSVIEKFSYDDNMPLRLIKNEKFDVYVENVNFAVGYIFPFEKIDISVVGRLAIPFGKWNKPADLDTSAPINNKWLNLNRTIETNIGTIFDINLTPIHFQIGGVYNYRNGDFTDRFLTNFLVGLNSVENTEISASLEYNTSLSDYKNEYMVSFWEYPKWSKTLNLELGYKMFFTDEFYINVGYNICLWAKNALATRNVNINIGYSF